jgi:hypothetical protein
VPHIPVVQLSQDGQLLVGEVVQHIAPCHRLPGERAGLGGRDGAAGHRRQHGANGLLEVVTQQRLAPSGHAQRFPEPRERLEHPGPQLQGVLQQARVPLQLHQPSAGDPDQAARLGPLGD